MADKKVSELTAITSVSGDDLLLVVNDPSGTPTSNKITVSNFFANVSIGTTFKANTVFSGNRVNISANVFIDGTNILDAVNDRMQVANVTSTYIANTVAFSTFANSANPIFTGSGTANTLTANSIFVFNPKGFLMRGGGLTIQVPSSSNATSEGIDAGTVLYSNSHLYIAVNGVTIKRIALESF